jgi:hypothetical protein
MEQDLVDIRQRRFISVTISSPPAPGVSGAEKIRVVPGFVTA